MEISTLEHHVLGGLIGTTTLSSKHTSDTHRLLAIADGQVAVGELMLYTVERLEGCAFGHGLHHNLMALHHVGIKAMQGLAIGHHDIIGDIDDIVDGTQADGCQTILQPVGRLLHFAIGDADASIALAGLLILDGHLDGQVVIVDLELRTVRTMHTCLVAIALQPGIQIACHAPVAQAVGTVGGNIDLDEPVALQVVVFCSGSTDMSQSLSRW